MNTFTPSSGVPLELVSIEFLLDKLNSQFQLPEPPTYEVSTLGGGVERHPHDETTLETDADRLAWADYQARLADAVRARNEALMRLVLLRGLKAELPADESWIADQEFLGLKVPGDPRERKLHWLTTEVLRTREDYEQAVTGVMAASGMPEEVIAQAQASFRRPVWRTAGDSAPGPASEKDGQELVREPAL